MTSSQTNHPSVGPTDGNHSAFDFRRFSAGHRTAIALIFAVYLALSLAGAKTGRPQSDEAVYANPGYNLAFNGHMGTTIFDVSGILPPSLQRYTYWQPPAYFVTTAAWFRAVGFDLFRTRLLSILFGLAALASWLVIGFWISEDPTLAVVILGAVSVDYFFLIAASQGRMEMMCIGLGLAAFASYVRLRLVSLPRALFVSHLLATLCILTHPVGLIYWLGLALAVLMLDLRRLSWGSLAAAAAPCLAGALGWGLYVRQAPPFFFEQMRAILEMNVESFGDGGPRSWLQSLRLEVLHRYIAPFGLGPDAGAFQRLKGIVLAAYLAGVLGLLLFPRLRGGKKALGLPILTLIGFFYLAFGSPSKFSYYLPHTTMFMAAAFAVLLYRSTSGSARRLVLLAGALIVGGIQVSGLLYRIYQNPFQRSFVPATQAMLDHSSAGALVVGSSEVWFGIPAQRQFRSDSRLGYQTKQFPSVFVMDPLYRLLSEKSAVPAPVRQYVGTAVRSAEKVYDDGYYQVYVPTAGSFVVEEVRR